MRVVALAFALAMIAATTASAGCWSSNTVADNDGNTMTTAQAPIQTPVPESADSDS